MIRSTFDGALHARVRLVGAMTCFSSELQAFDGALHVRVRIAGWHALQEEECLKRKNKMPGNRRDMT
jgi:hypothetical protein